MADVRQRSVAGLKGGDERRSWGGGERDVSWGEGQFVHGGQDEPLRIFDG